MSDSCASESSPGGLGFQSWVTCTEKHSINKVQLSSEPPHPPSFPPISSPPTTEDLSQPQPLFFFLMMLQGALLHRTTVHKRTDWWSPRPGWCLRTMWFWQHCTQRVKWCVWETCQHHRDTSWLIRWYSETGPDFTETIANRLHWYCLPHSFNPIELQTLLCQSDPWLFNRGILKPVNWNAHHDASKF